MTKRRPGVPLPSSEDAHRRMKATRQRDTAPEVKLRSELHRLGLRYRVDACPIPGWRRRADLVFHRARVAVFVDGCFWHGCPIHATWPTANAGFWRDKIETNRRRDCDTDRVLELAGWLSVRVWEHEDPAAAATRVAGIVRSRWPGRSPVRPRSGDPYS